MRDVALTRKQIRVLAAVAAAEAADEPPSLGRVAERVPLRPDLVEDIAGDLCRRALLTFHGEYAPPHGTPAPGPELRLTARGHDLLSAVRAPA